MKRAQKFLLNTLILTGSTLLIRTIGVSFNVYLSNKIGAAGIGLYSLILSVYTLAVTFASSGVRLSTTRLVVMAQSKEQPDGVKSTVRHCLFYSGCTGTFAAFLLYFAAPYLAEHWLQDMRTLSSLRCLSIALPFLAMSSALSGYFTAMRGIVKFAGAQFFEQLVKITVTIMALTVLMPKGLEYACLSLVAGSCIAEASSCGLLFLLYMGEKKKFPKVSVRPKSITRRLLGIALPDAVSSCIRSGLLTVEHLLIPVGFRKSGISGESALAAYGTVHGMVFPIITFPSALLGALADLLIPEIAECYALKQVKRTRYIITRVLQMSLFFAIGAMGILFSFSKEFGKAIYNDSLVGQYIHLLAPLIPVMYLDTAVDGMLKGLGQQLSSMRYNIIDASCCVLMVYFLLPKYAMTGYLVTLYATEILNFMLSIHRLYKIAPFRMDVLKAGVLPIFSILGAVSATKALHHMISFSGQTPMEDLIMKILITLPIYYVALRVFTCISKEDLNWAKNLFRLRSHEKQSHQ